MGEGDDLGGPEVWVEGLRVAIDLEERESHYKRPNTERGPNSG